MTKRTLLLNPSRRISRRQALVFAGTMAIVGVVVVVTIFAAGTPVAFEAESGTLAGCASAVSDSGASGGSAVKFSACSSGSSLDESGATIPDTNYAIPSGAIFMATTGSDSNSGTQGSPVATLTKAVSLVPNAGTIVVRAGVYRDGNVNTYKVFNLQPYPHESAWFDGTDVQPTGNWTSDGSGHWYMSWNTPSLCNGHYYDAAYNNQSASGPCAFYDEYGDANYPAAGDPQMVFIDGTYVNEVTSLSAASGNNFYYDWTNKRIYIATNPSGHTVELASRPYALAVQGGAGGGSVRGLGFTRYASNEYDANVTQAAVLGNEPNMTFENNVFSHMAGSALAVADPRGVSVKANVFAYNGANGLDSNGHENGSGETDGLLIQDNIFNGNNAEHFGPGCNYSCMAAGSKLAHMDGYTLKNNLFENGVGTAHGFWCDEACTNGIMVGNVARNNGGTGIFYEVSDTGVIASNLIYGNGGYGIKMGSADTDIYNNTLVNNNVGLLLYDDQRYYVSSTDNYTEGTQFGPNTVNTDFSNNVLVNNRSTNVQSWRTSTAGNSTGPNTFYSGYDYNSYYRSGTSPALSEWRDGTDLSYNSLSSFVAAHSSWEAHGRDITDGSNPFVNLSGGNYAINGSNADASNGKALPAAVANALGLSGGGTVTRGAIKWWPNGD